MKKTISLILALVFTLSLGSIAFAQNSNSSTGGTTTRTMKHRKHRKHHRRHRRSMRKTGGNTNT